MAFFKLECGKKTEGLPISTAFLSIIIMLEIESIVKKNYHDDFLTPGSIPSFANSLKQIRQIPKSRIKAFPRPQRKHRFFSRVLNLCTFLFLANTDAFAINKFTGITLAISHFFTYSFKLLEKIRR